VIFHVEVNIEPAQAERMFGEEERPAAREVQYAGGGPEQPSAMSQAASAPQAVPGITGGAHPAPVSEPAGPAPATANPTTVVKDDQQKIGRNDPCWCGSGKKYKKCHGA
jgi:preprotein translocase subunit SecA